MTTRQLPVRAGPVAPPTISTTLLLPHERVALASLGRWAERLDTRLTRCRDTLRTLSELAATVSDIANNTALVATHQGQPSTARTLCERQIQWQCRLARRSKTSWGLPHALQPWINLGRLDALSGKWEAALERFARLRELRDGGRIDLGPMCIGTRQCEALSSTPDGLRRHLTTVYVVDSLRALLLNRRFAEAADFAWKVELDCPAEPARLAVEASIIATCRLGDHASAENLAAMALDRARGWDRAVFQLRMAEVLGCAGERVRAAEILSRSAAVLEGVSLGRKKKPDVLPALVRFASACAEVDLHSEALDLARDTREAARAGGDEVVEIESLRILARLSPAPQQWRDALGELETATDYHRYRPERGHAGNPALQLLYERVLQFLGD